VTTKEIDYKRCVEGPAKGHKHEWRYMGKFAGEYECWNCDLRVSKSALKGGTDA